jgi:hypothetical protein
MSDILSFGRDREPRWRRRRWQRAAAVIGIAVALAAVVIWHLPGLRQHGGRPGPGALRSSPVAPGSPGVLTPVPSPLPAEPTRMTGQPLPRSASVWLLLGGHRPTWLSVGDGRTQPIRGLPGSGTGYQLFRIVGGWAAQPFPSGNASCGKCAPPPLPVYYVADRSRAASRIGVAEFTAPAATAGALWLISYRHGAKMSTAADAQEVTVTGAALGPRLRLPAGYLIDQGTRAGLLLVQELAGPGSYELWDPGTRRVTRSFGNLIAASPAEIAWMPSCTAGCRVHVLDLPSGRVREISLPGRSKSYAGTFSPDGRLLALLVTTRGPAAGRTAAFRLIVATLATGRITAVPGTTVIGMAGVAFGWQPGSHQLIADVSVGDRWQIAVWRPGQTRLTTALARALYNSWPVIDQGPY